MNLAAEQPLTRERISTFVLISLAGIGVAVCALVAAPFVPAITWALALGVVAYPIHRRVHERVRRPGLAAVLSVAIITIILLGPTVFLVRQIGVEASAGYERLEKQVGDGKLDDTLEEKLDESIRESPQTGGILRWIRRNLDVEKEMEGITASLQRRLGGWVRGTIWTVIQLLITIFLLFYLFRDSDQALATLRRFLPLSDRESDYVLERTRVMIHATIYGTLVVASVQGTLGGAMFWILGIPGALLWGVAMGLLSIIPLLGAFVIWVPAAIGLAAQGDWMKALILTAWGTIVVGLIDNFLYPVLVGNEMRMHTVPVFIALLGGLVLFGASGLVIGPVVLAVTMALIDILRRRTAGNRSAQDPT
jgi:predicted PurR-regulated permease PerM